MIYDEFVIISKFPLLCLWVLQHHFLLGGLEVNIVQLIVSQLSLNVLLSSWIDNLFVLWVESVGDEHWFFGLTSQVELVK